MSLQLGHGETIVVLPALQHGPLAISTPADRQQGQILLKVLELVELIPPWCTLWCMHCLAVLLLLSCGSCSAS
ncbi:hypothetical protein KBY70_11655 [Cyanobium sp. ATX 6E8]|uniref:hypothetical protein n=1 Tax=Cyanobium sp. ATX 6E8 TaxID=2823701 RepID=UPI0020CCF276|nr:hypothetical protein [Cyanobium sp. ATX 6E8]MCP9943045.1 hypothetical protein [Cyanobium sp. ATX 6E8]